MEVVINLLFHVVCCFIEVLYSRSVFFLRVFSAVPVRSVTARVQRPVEWHSYTLSTICKSIHKLFMASLASYSLCSPSFYSILVCMTDI